MTRINTIQNAIKQMEGGAFHKMFDEYIYKKWHYDNIQSFGIQQGTNKSIKGVPDTYITHDDGTYTLFMYGTSNNTVVKIEHDLKDVLNPDKLSLEKDKIREIILFHTEVRLSIPVTEHLKAIAPNIKVKFVGLDTLAQDLNQHFGSIAKDHLGISVNSGQLLDMDVFVQEYDANQVMAPLDIEFQVREKELAELNEKIAKKKAILVTGKSGVGKTKLVLEAVHSFKTRGFIPVFVKNNGLSLYEDFKMEINQTENYILVFDDVNQTSDLEPILNDLSTSYPNVKIIATVRDYQKEKFKESFLRFNAFEEYVLKEFSKADLREILKESLNINNQDVQDKIIEIAKGNVRIAVLAAKLARQELQSINTVIDIFQAHFNPIIQKNELTNEDINTLFVIAFFNKVQTDVDIETKKMLKAIKLDEAQFESSIQKLRTRELIDFYLGIATISDQSFRDYILQYVLLNQKSINLKNIINLFFEHSSEATTYVLRTLLALFPSKEDGKYIIDSANTSWNEAPENLQDAYLQSFYGLNYPKSLRIIKNKLDSYEDREFEITEEFFNKNENNNRISTSELEILSGLYNSPYRVQAIQLMVSFLKKRPDLFMDVYFAMKKFIYSSQNVYTDDLELVKQLMKMRSYAEWNFDYLIIKIIEQLLKVITERIQSNDISSITIVTIRLQLTSDNKELRSTLWESLSELYKTIEYRPYIHEVLLGVDWRTHEGLDLDIMQYDFDCIIQCFDEHWQNIDFEQMNILYNLHSKGEKYGLVIDSRYRRFSDYTDFTYYFALVLLSQMEGNLDSESKKISKVNAITGNYNLGDFEKLFTVAARLVKLENGHRKYLVGNALRLIIESSNQSILKLLDVYFDHGSPFSAEVTAIVYKLSAKERKNILEILQKYEFEDKNSWLNAIWDATHEDDITQELAAEFVEYVKSQLNYQYPILPSIDTILNFKKFVPNILLLVAEQAVFLSEKNQYVVYNLLIRNHLDPAKIVELFSEDMDLLEKLYLRGIGVAWVDYEEKILIEILNRDESFWKKYVQELNHNAEISIGRVGHAVFPKIWLLDNYNILISQAFELLVLKTNKYVFYATYETYESIFETNDAVAEERRIEWICRYIKTHHDDDIRMKSLFNNYISTQSEADKLHYWEIFLSKKNDINLFKTMALLPVHSQWSGSEVPIIDQQIHFIEKLIELPLFIDINYIEHQEYLMEVLAELKKTREKVQRREYKQNLM